MKVWLVHNESAGDGTESRELRRALEAAGHTIVKVVEPSAAALGLDPGDVELVVVAGGDGTVRKVATALAGRPLPLGLLSIGTANNIATSLGIDTEPPPAIAAWATSRPVRLDLGLVRGAVDGRMIESVGGGLIAEGIHTMDSEHHADSEAEQMLAKAVVRFREVLAALTPRRCLVSIDGAPLVGDYLLVEVMNIAAVGPNVALAPAARPTDGLFDVVLAGETERAALDRYLAARIAGHPATLTLPTRRARTIEVTGFDRIHLDDRIHDHLAAAPFTVKVERAAVEVLLPSEAAPTG